MFTPPMLQCHSSPSIMNNPHDGGRHVEIAPNCPRCASANTKFCYYNNYSLWQPRYFCKGCRRYWTKGGSLRNVPVGGGCRKNRRTSRSARLSTAESANGSSRSSNYHHHRNCSSNCGDDASEDRERGDGTDIDMADVFAKFLSQKDPDLVGSDDANALSDHSQISLNPSEDALDGVALLENRDQQPLDEDESIRSIMGNPYHEDLSVHEFGLQGLIEEEDVFWCETTASMTSISSAASFTWQDLDGSFPSDDDDQTKISIANENLHGNNWSSFDFSSLGVFS